MAARVPTFYGSHEGPSPSPLIAVTDPPAPTGLEAVLLENRGKLLRFLAAHGAGDQAEDLLQELWLKIAGTQTGPIAQPFSYLYRAANNLMLDRYRTVRQQKKREQDWSDVAGATAPGRSDEPAADRALIAREELQRMQAALDSLGPRPAAIFRRHRIDGISQRDIAAEMGVSLSTVEGDLRKAYQLVIEQRMKKNEAAAKRVRRRSQGVLMEQTADDMRAEALDWIIRQRDPAFDDWEAFADWLDADPVRAELYQAMAVADQDAARCSPRLPRRSRSLPPQRHGVSVGADGSVALSPRRSRWCSAIPRSPRTPRLM